MLATKYFLKREWIEEFEQRIRTYADPVIHCSVLIQEESYVTAMDEIMLAGVKQINGTLVTVNTELHPYGAKSPE